MRILESASATLPLGGYASFWVHGWAHDAHAHHRSLIHTGVTSRPREGDMSDWVAASDASRAGGWWRRGGGNAHDVGVPRQHTSPTAGVPNGAISTRPVVRQAGCVRRYTGGGYRAFKRAGSVPRALPGRIDYRMALRQQ